MIIVNDLRLQAAISRKWLQILENHDRLARLWNVGFPSVLLETTRKVIPLDSRVRTQNDFHRRVVAEWPCS